MSRLAELTSFVAIGPGEWSRAATLNEVLALIRKRLGHKRGKPLDPLVIFASDKPLAVSVDCYVRVTAEEGAVLVRMEA